MGSSPTNPNADVLLRLGYDASDKSGIEQAKRDVAKFKADAILLGTQLQQARAKLAAEDTAENRRQLQKQITELRSALASATSAIRGKRGAERQASLEAQREIQAELKGRLAQVEQLKVQREEVRRLNTELIAARSGLSRATGAVSIARGAGPGLADQIAAAIRTSFLESAVLRSLPGAGALSEGASAARLAGGGILASGGAFALAAVPLLLKEVFDGFKTAGLEAGRFADEVDEAGQRAGLSARDMLVLHSIGKTVGLDMRDMATATRQLSAAIVGGGGEDGIEGAGNRGAKVLAALGIASRDSRGNARSFYDVLVDIAGVFQQLPDGAEKTRIAVELLGKAGQNFIPFLNKGPEGIRSFLAAIQDFLPELSGTAELFNELEEAQARYELSVLGLKNSLSQSIIPTVTRFTNELAALLLIWKQFGASGVLEQLLTGGVSTEGAPSLAQFGRAIGIRNNQIAFRGQADEKLFRSALEKISANERAGRDKFSVTGFDDQDIRSLFVELQKVRGGDARQNVFNEFLRRGAIEIRGQVAAEKNLGEEMENRLKKLREIWDGDKDENERKRQAVQLEEERKRTIELRADLAKTIAEAEAKTAGDELERFRILRERADVVAAALDKARDAQAGAEADTEDARLSLAARLKAQKNLNDALEQGKKLIAEQATLTKEQADALGDLLKESPLPEMKAIPPALGGTPAGVATRDFQEELATLRVEEALGVNVLNQELAVREALNQSLIEQIRLRLASGVATKQEQDALEGLLRDLKSNRDAIGKLRLDQFNKGGLGSLLSGLKQFSDIVGKFSPALNRGLGQMFALFEGIAATLGQLRLAGGGAQDASGNVIGGSALSGLGAIFRRGSGLNFGQRLSGLLGIAGTGAGVGQILAQFIGGTFGRGAGPGRGALGGAGLGILGTGLTALALNGGNFAAAFGLGGALGPIGIAAAAGLAIFGGLRGSAQKKTRRIAKEIRDQIKDTLTAFNEGRSNLKDTIAGLERERADAIARLSGKKGGKKELQPILDELDKSLTELRSKQKQILDSFTSQLGLLLVPEGARDAAEAIQNIAKAMKEAADAGASAAQQTEFLNRSLDQLKTKIGRDLRSEEQETIDLLLQNIDLQKQREKIIEDAADREKQVRQSLGLERALTPEQSAAKQIAAIRKQRDEQIKALDEQQARLNAELEGRSELFDLNLEGLDVDAQRTSLIDRQLVLQREITAELVAQIQAQQDFYADLAAGRIPALPAGVLPSGFAAPAGASFQIGTVNINLPSGVTPGQAEELGRSAIAGMLREARIRQEQGFPS